MEASTSESDSSVNKRSPRTSVEEDVQNDFFRKHISRMETFIQGKIQGSEDKKGLTEITFFDEFLLQKEHTLFTESIYVFNKYLSMLRTAAVNYNVRDLPFELHRSYYLKKNPLNDDFQIQLYEQPDIWPRFFCGALARYLFFLEHRDLVPTYVPDESRQLQPIITEEEKDLRKILHQCGDNRDQLRSMLASCPIETNKKKLLSDLKISLKLPLYPKGILEGNPSLIEIVKESYRSNLPSEHYNKIYEATRALLQSKRVSSEFERQLSRAHMQL